jgi:hypothetical protein
MGEDEFEWRIQAQKLLLLPHDQIVRALGVIPIGLIVFLGIRPTTLLVDREVTVVYLLGGPGEVNFGAERLVVRMPPEPLVFFSKIRA